MSEHFACFDHAKAQTEERHTADIMLSEKLSTWNFATLSVLSLKRLSEYSLAENTDVPLKKAKTYLKHIWSLRMQTDMKSFCFVLNTLKNLTGYLLKTMQTIPSVFITQIELYLNYGTCPWTELASVKG